MRLNFNVLWIDDQPQNLVGYEENFDNKVKKEGFKLKVEWAKSLAEAMPRLSDHVFTDDIDLVIVDYDLGLSGKGDDAVREVRSRVPFKDIVFYSAIETAELKKLIAAGGIEGVWCAYRPSLSDTLNSLFEALIKKVLDIDHCRGIVMGATSDIDYIVNASLLALVPLLNATHKTIADEYIIERLNQRVQRFNNVLDTFNETKSMEQVFGEHEAFTATDKLKLLKEILGHHFDNDHSDLRKALGKYINDVTPLRNTLGHARLVADGALKILRGRDAKIVTADQLKQHRLHIIQYREQIEALITILELMLD